MNMKKKKKYLLIIVFCILFFTSLLIWRIFIHISPDYIIATRRAVEFADEILEGDRSAFYSFRHNSEEFYTIFENISNPIGRHEYEMARLFMLFTTNLSSVSLAEMEYFSVTVRRGADPNDPAQYHLFVKSEEDYIRDKNALKNSRIRLFDTRNQMAEIIGIEQREAFETLRNWEELAHTSITEWRSRSRSTNWVPGEPNPYGTNESLSDFNLPNPE